MIHETTTGAHDFSSTYKLDPVIHKLCCLQHSSKIAIFQTSQPRKLNLQAVSTKISRRSHVTSILLVISFGSIALFRIPFSRLRYTSNTYLHVYIHVNFIV